MLELLNEAQPFIIIACLVVVSINMFLIVGTLAAQETFSSNPNIGSVHPGQLAHGAATLSGVGYGMGETSSSERFSGHDLESVKDRVSSGDYQSSFPQRRTESDEDYKKRLEETRQRDIRRLKRAGHSVEEMSSKPEVGQSDPKRFDTLKPY